MVHAYTAALANEHPEITSTSYCPGPIDTDMSRSIELEKYLPKIFTRTEGAETGIFLVQTEKSKLVNGGFYAENQNRSRINAPFR